MATNKTAHCAGEPGWRFCGAVPLAAIAKGRRACRAGWRARGDGYDKLAVVVCTDRSLGLEREDDEYFSIEGEPDIDDLIAMDWSVEVVARKAKL